jgi:hypothetical protein
LSDDPRLPQFACSNCKNAIENFNQLRDKISDFEELLLRRLTPVDQIVVKQEIPDTTQLPTPTNEIVNISSSSSSSSASVSSEPQVDSTTNNLPLAFEANCRIINNNNNNDKNNNDDDNASISNDGFSQNFDDNSQNSSMVVINYDPKLIGDDEISIPSTPSTRSLLGSDEVRSILNDFESQHESENTSSTVNKISDKESEENSIKKEFRRCVVTLIRLPIQLVPSDTESDSDDHNLLQELSSKQKASKKRKTPPLKEKKLDEIVNSGNSNSTIKPNSPRELPNIDQR